MENKLTIVLLTFNSSEKVVKFDTYVARRNPNSEELPAFMQNVSNKISLDVLHQKSLKE